MRIAATLVTTLVLALASTQAFGERTDGELREDLRAVIILAGYPCGDVLTYTLPAADEYHVTCNADRMYTVTISEESGVRVRNLSNPLDRGVGADPGHDAFMRRQLFAIVNLAGHDCDRVLSYMHAGPRESLVTCDNQVVYRIRVTPEGRIDVRQRAGEK